MLMFPSDTVSVQQIVSARMGGRGVQDLEQGACTWMTLSMHSAPVVISATKAASIGNRHG